MSNLQPVEDFEAGVSINRRENVLDVELLYPRSDLSKIQSVQIGLMCVRAAQDIRVEYDFERDGWKVTQKVTTGWKDVGTHLEDIEESREVAFIAAWHPDHKDYEEEIFS